MNEIDSITKFILKATLKLIYFQIILKFSRKRGLLNRKQIPNGVKNYSNLVFFSLNQTIMVSRSITCSNSIVIYHIFAGCLVNQQSNVDPRNDRYF